MGTAVIGQSMFGASIAEMISQGTQLELDGENKQASKNKQEGETHTYNASNLHMLNRSSFFMTRKDASSRVRDWMALWKRNGE